MAAILAATVAMPHVAGATDLKVTHWWTSGGEAAAVAEFAKAFDATGNKWVDGAIAGSGDTARPIIISRILGGNLQIVVPVMKPVLVTIFVRVSSGAMRIYDLVVALTDGGPGIASDVPSRYIYQNFSANLGQSLSASTVMLVSMALVLIPWIRMEFGKKKQG